MLLRLRLLTLYLPCDIKHLSVSRNNKPFQVSKTEIREKAGY